MRAVSCALAAMLAALPSAALAQGSPYKLIVSWYQSNLTVIDYPNKERCETAAKAVNTEVARRVALSDAQAPPGSIRLGGSPNGAFCIPG